MTTLTGQKIKNSYKDLLQVSNSNSGIDATLRDVSDGEGTACPMQLSSSYINITALKYNGNVVAFSGSFSTTLTVTASTNVTLPTTGTLSTLAGSETLSNKTLTAPILGTPASGNLSNCTAYPLAQLTGAASGVLTFLATPTSVNLKSAVTDETGSGALVFATSPTLVTPILGTPSSGNLSSCTAYPLAQLTGAGTGVLTFLATPSSANLATALTDETGTGVVVFGTSPTITTPNIVGTVAAGNATAGSVGEYISASIASASAVSLVSQTAKTVTSISLTAGDWDVDGCVGFTLNGSTASFSFGGGISLTTNVMPTADLGGMWGRSMPSSASNNQDINHIGSCSNRRINVSSTTTVYLVAQCGFTVSTAAAYGLIGARRVR